MSPFVAILSPVLVLFICMAIGFALRKTNTVPNNTAKSLAKLETWVFCPALAFSSMSISFTPESIASHSTNLIFAICVVAIALAIGIALSYIFVKEKSYERGVYQYALVFSNLGYMADPLVRDMFGDAVLGAYKFFCLPFTIVIYIWGISILTPKSDEKSSPIKRLLNFPTVALLLGMVAGITNLFSCLPDFFSELINNTLNSLKACMGPVAMIIAGLTIANYDIKKLVVKKKVYIATLFRLIILPSVLLSIVIGARYMINAIFSLNIGAEPIYFTFFATAMALGMNTVVFPEAYGGDPEPGASMALISSTLSVLTVPLMYMLLNIIVPCPFA